MRAESAAMQHKKRKGVSSVAQALRQLRTRSGLSQVAASQRKDAPDFRTISHWETSRKAPSFDKLRRYLDSLNFDLHDLQDAIDQMEGRIPKRLVVQTLREGSIKIMKQPKFRRLLATTIESRLQKRLAVLEARLRRVEQKVGD